MKPNCDKLPIEFDETLVSLQLNTIGAAPLVQLMHNGYSAKLSYSEISAKIIPYITNNAKFHLQDVYGDILNAIGCGSNAYKLGKTQIFFRPKNDHFADMLLALDTDASKNIAKKVSEKFCVRQRHAIWISLRFIGASKFN